MRYGTSAPKEPADLVSLRVTVLGTHAEAAAPQVHEGEATPPKEGLARPSSRCTSAAPGLDTPVYKRDDPASGNRIGGPALIEEHASTTVVQPGDELPVDEFGNLQISIGSDRT